MTLISDWHSLSGRHAEHYATATKITLFQTRVAITATEV
jgi:hypothetical protein